MKVEQHAKTKKTTYCNLEPFKVKLWVDSDPRFDVQNNSTGGDRSRQINGGSLNCRWIEFGDDQSHPRPWTELEKILRDLYMDNRTRELPNFAILSKMFYDQLIRPDELVEFKKTLKTHHLAKLNNSLAILEEEDDDDNSNSDPNSF
ncbi:hypothetical protein PPACK8108_LOCUS18557 [Phakopsora pachyrhizi]|uniref:Uncharacterized protein n=1 Tax=Phakopsora pachyrhizi TaxID=170000 RepID=A0AAV0BCF3_PHAPC|nr:hypothetical protein PPACK8108_LOCUS18557 [Phakopsora pachyrhizi]